MSVCTPRASCASIHCVIAGHKLPAAPKLGDTAMCRRCLTYLEFGRLFVSNLMTFGVHVAEMGEFKTMWMLPKEGDE